MSKPAWATDEAMDFVLRFGHLNFEAGARDFEKWSAAMIEDIGEPVRVVLDEIWETVQKEGSQRSNAHTQVTQQLAVESPADTRYVPPKEPTFPGLFHNESNSGTDTRTAPTKSAFGQEHDKFNSAPASCTSGSRFSCVLCARSRRYKAGELTEGKYYATFASPCMSRNGISCITMTETQTAANPKTESKTGQRASLKNEMLIKIL